MTWLTLAEAASQLGLSYEGMRDRIRAEPGRYATERRVRGRRGGRPQVLVAACCVRAELTGRDCDGHRIAS